MHARLSFQKNFNISSFDSYTFSKENNNFLKAVKTIIFQLFVDYASVDALCSNLQSKI